MGLSIMVRDMLEAIRERNLPKARAALDALDDWYKIDGFPPLIIDDVLDAAERALARPDI